MYTESDILKEVKNINNILGKDEYSELLNIIQQTSVQIDNIFQNNNQYHIGLTNNEYIRENIFPIIKDKFNYKGDVKEIVCKIQSHTDNEEYHTLSEDKDTVVFSLDINRNTNIGLTNLTKVSIVREHRKYNDYVQKIITDASQNVLSYIENLDIPVYLKNRLSCNRYDDLTFLEDYREYPFTREFFLEKQNILDNQGYLYILPNDGDQSTGFAYEHIDNNCIQFPAYYIHKMKPYMKLTTHRRISILFVCKKI
jgi:hypothetical protein